MLGKVIAAGSPDSVRTAKQERFLRAWFFLRGFGAVAVAGTGPRTLREYSDRGRPGDGGPKAIVHIQ